MNLCMTKNKQRKKWKTRPSYNVYRTYAFSPPMFVFIFTHYQTRWYSVSRIVSKAPYDIEKRKISVFVISATGHPWMAPSSAPDADR